KRGTVLRVVGATRNPRLMIRNQRRDVTARMRGRWHEIACAADDEVGNLAVTPGRIPSGGWSCAENGDAERGHEPQAIAALTLHHEHITRGIGLFAARRPGTETHIGAVVRIGLAGSTHDRDPTRADELIPAIVALAQQQLADPDPVALARNHAAV